MLENTFCHIPGIGRKTEYRLWASGVRSWRDVRRGRSIPLSEKRAAELRERIIESTGHLITNNPAYFAEALPANEHWRMFPQFKDTTAYLDIETTGLNDRTDHITTIALYDGDNIRHYVRGDNLLDFPDDIRRFKLIVTYNGKSFDVPFLQHSFGIQMNHVHIDLRHVLHSLGYTGGLKSCERQLGITRGGMEDLDGFFAVLLWDDYQARGNRRALETLLAYNIMDTINLATLMVMAYNLKIADTPFADSHILPIPGEPRVPFSPDFRTIARIRRHYGI